MTPIHHQKLRQTLKGLKYLSRYIGDNKDSLKLTYGDAYFTTYILFRVHHVYKAKKGGPRKKHDDIGKAKDNEQSKNPGFWDKL